MLRHRHHYRIEKGLVRGLVPPNGPLVGLRIGSGYPRPAYPSLLLWSENHNKSDLKAAFFLPKTVLLGHRDETINTKRESFHRVHREF